jgi:hypothetical protein
VSRDPFFVLDATNGANACDPLPAPSPRPEGSTDPEPLGTCDSPSAAGRPHRETRHCVNWEPVRAPAPEPVRGFTLSPEDLKSAGEMLGNIAPGFAGKAPPPAPTRDGTTLTEETGGSMSRSAALAMFANAIPWLRERVGGACSCGGCYLCAYNALREERDA